MAFIVLFSISVISIQDGRNPGLELFVKSRWIRLIGDLLLVCTYLVVWMENLQLAQKMKRTMADVNLTLAPLGYRVRYQVEATGDLLTNEHRIYVFDLRPHETLPSSLEIFRRLPPTYKALPSEPVTIYLFASWYSHCWCSCCWPLGFRRPPFFQEGRPPELGALSDVLWGGLHSSLHVPALTEGPAKMRTFLIAMPMVTVMLSFDTFLYWFLPLLLLVSLFALSVSSCVHQASVAREQQQGR